MIQTADFFELIHVTSKLLEKLFTTKVDGLR